MHARLTYGLTIRAHQKPLANNLYASETKIMLKLKKFKAIIIEEENTKKMGSVLFLSPESKIWELTTKARI